MRRKSSRVSIGIFPIGHPSEEDELGRLEDEEEYKSSEEKRHPRKKASSHSLPLVWSDCLIDVLVGGLVAGSQQAV